jgi:hypothetical protein
MLRICLFGPPKRRKQPERYAPFVLKLVVKSLTKTYKDNIMVFMENGTYKFMAEIKKVPDIDGAYIEFLMIYERNLEKAELKYTQNLTGSLMRGVL